VLLLGRGTGVFVGAAKEGPSAASCQLLGCSEPWHTDFTESTTKENSV
jgi:hypothetical protein